MSYVTLASPYFWPPEHDALAASSSMLMDASGEKVMGLIRVPETGTLDGFEVMLATVTQAPASGLTFSFQDADSSAVPAVPDGTADQSSTVTSGIATNTWLASGTMTRSVTAGDVLACVLEFASFGAGDSLNVRRVTTYDHWQPMPYCGLYTGTWAMQNGGLSMALRYASGVYYPVQGVVPWSTFITTTGTYNSGSTPDEYALKMVLPYGCKSSGYVVWVDTDNATDIVLYDSGSSVVASSTMVPNLRSSSNGVGTVGYWSAKQTLAAGTYYLSVKPTSGSNISARYMEVATAAIMAAANGGVGATYATRTDAGAWTETTTRRLVAQLIISDIDIGSAGGGLLRHPGMAGGMNG